MTEGKNILTDSDKVQGSEEVVIDLNKPETPTSTSTSTPNYNVVPSKRIDELTDDEKTTLINNARAGVDNPYYDVKLFKNGKTRICKRKKPTISNQAVISKGEKLYMGKNGEQKVYMTDSQLMWEHVLELENKYNSLYRKHKKLKSKYNDLYVEDDNIVNEKGLCSFEEQRSEPIKEEVNEPMKEPINEPINEKGHSSFEEQRSEHDLTQIQPTRRRVAEPLASRTWRSSLMANKNFYIN